MDISRDTLTQTILDIRAQYVAKGHTLFDIGNGLCENFVHDVLDTAVGSHWPTIETYHNWHTLWTDMLIENDQWTLPTPDGAHWDKLALIQPAHCWIVLDDYHFDCEHPEGVFSPFSLSFFQRNHAGLERMS